MSEENRWRPQRQKNQRQQRFERPNNTFPGGVNSPARAFGAVGGGPRFFKRGKGSHVWDIDGNGYY